jgi:hypothetical protein
VLVLAAYIVPAAVAWAAIGLALSLLAQAAHWLATAAVAAAAVYGCGYGAAEVRGSPWPAAPGRRWQVPQDLLIGVSGSRRVLIWGSILGPGFLTRNPYAGFGLLPVLVATSASGLPAGGRVLAPIVVGGMVGATHAAGRAGALLRDSARRQDQPFALLLRSLRWRVLDGLALLTVAGAAIVVAGFRLR